MILTTPAHSKKVINYDYMAVFRKLHLIKLCKELRILMHCLLNRLEPSLRFLLKAQNAIGPQIYKGFLMGMLTEAMSTIPKSSR